MIQTKCLPVLFFKYNAFFKKYAKPFIGSLRAVINPFKIVLVKYCLISRLYFIYRFTFLDY